MLNFLLILSINLLLLYGTGDILHFHEDHSPI